MRHPTSSHLAATLLALAALACERPAATQDIGVASATPTAAAAPATTEATPAPVATTDAEVPRVTVADAKAAVDAGAAVIVDVRDGGSFEAAHIKGALHIPVNMIEARLAELPRDKRILTYCS